MQAGEQILSDKLLHQFAERAGVYDRENRFFHEDFEDLKRAGYLTIPVPKELGGAGMSLAEVSREQRRLAYYAPATALGVNMHLFGSGWSPISGAKATARSNGC
jgi:alkylation response protein AidB-like acyl-CoA dehydrogenase